jgi:hypothetical protein
MNTDNETRGGGLSGQKPSRQRRVTRAMEHKLIEPLLLTPEECAAVLGIGPETFYRHAPQIVARHGLMPVICGKVKKYSYAQLRGIVEECVRTGEPLYETD